MYFLPLSLWGEGVIEWLWWSSSAQLGKTTRTLSIQIDHKWSIPRYGHLEIHKHSKTWWVWAFRCNMPFILLVMQWENADTIWLYTRSVLRTLNHFLYWSLDPIASRSHISSLVCAELAWKWKETLVHRHAFWSHLPVVESGMALWKPFMLHWLSSTLKHLDKMELLAKWFIMARTLCFTFTLHNELGMYIYYAVQG